MEGKESGIWNPESGRRNSQPSTETLRYPEIGVRVTGSVMFFHFVVTSSTLPGRTSRFSGVDTSLPVEDLRVAASPT